MNGGVILHSPLRNPVLGFPLGSADLRPSFDQFRSNRMSGQNLTNNMKNQNTLKKCFLIKTSFFMGRCLLSGMSLLLLIGVQSVFSQNEIVTENALPGNPPAE